MKPKNYNYIVLGSLHETINLRMTKKQEREAKEKEEYLRKNQNGKFGSIY